MLFHLRIQVFWTDQIFSMVGRDVKVQQKKTFSEAGKEVRAKARFGGETWGSNQAEGDIVRKHFTDFNIHKISICTSEVNHRI